MSRPRLAYCTSDDDLDFARSTSVSALTQASHIAPIGAMDTDALAFELARHMFAEGRFERFVAERYSGYDSGHGRDIEKGKANFKSLEKLVLTKLGEPTPRSGKQEYLENLLTQYLHG